MSIKSKNMEAAKKLALAAWWSEEYKELFTDDFTVDFTNAPPGMPNHMDEFEVWCFKQWMNRTTKNWYVEQEYFTASGDDYFFAYGYCGGDTHWGEVDSSLRTKYIYKFTMRNGLCRNIRMMMNPLAFLQAAGRETPIFRMDLYSDKVEAYMAANPPQEHPQPELDPSPEACAIRRRETAEAFIFGGEPLMAPYVESYVWFLPEEMKEHYEPDMQARVDAWGYCTIDDTCINLYPEFAKLYPTDDPHTFFAENHMAAYFPWPEYTNVDTWYHNTYFYIVRVDDMGRMVCFEEFMNPVNKFNSINVSMPTFPYYL